MIMESDMVWNLDCCIKKILLDINFSARNLHQLYSPSVEEGFAPGKKKS